MNRLRALFVLQAIIIASGMAMAQSLDFSVREVIITTPDSLIKASIWNKPGKRKVNPGYHYYWYYSGTVNHNVGGFSGKLLHGKYEVFDNQQKLRVQGLFEHGVMTGVWNRWYPNGNIEFTGTYKNGMLQGEVKNFAKDGTMQEMLHYGNGKLNGNAYFFYRDTVIAKRYKDGREIIKKKKQPCKFFKKRTVKKEVAPPKVKNKQAEKPAKVHKEEAKPNEKAKKPWWQMPFLKKKNKTGKKEEQKTPPSP